MRGLLATLLICTTGIASARAELAIPVSEEVYGFLVILSVIVIAIVFISAFIADRRGAREKSEMRRLRPESEAPPKPLSEVEKAQARATRGV